MGRNIYLTDKEISQLIYACKTYINWSYEDDICRELVESDLKKWIGFCVKKIKQRNY